MTIKFIKKYNRFEVGEVRSDVFRADGDSLIAQGFAEEVQPIPPVQFVKHDWAAERASQAAKEAAELKRQNADKKDLGGGLSKPNKTHQEVSVERFDRGV